MPEKSVQTTSQRKKESLCLLGAHFSIAKGLHNALYAAKAMDCTALQLFTKNSQTWKERSLSQEDISFFEKAKKETDIKEIAAHTSYLINLASHEKQKHAMSYAALKQELIRCSHLNIPYTVLHPGAHMGKGENHGIRVIAESINRIFAEIPKTNVRLLLETTAGQGTGIGHTFEQLAAIMDKIEDRDRIGICLDTCHIFAAGYDIRTEKSYKNTMDTFDSVIGLEYLYLIHLNDSKKDLGSRVDRHEHIGKGAIGINAFDCIMNDKRLKNVPKIIETPKGEKRECGDKVNLSRLRALLH
ncbi:MAG: deoxyribonuclease IV [Deltaproteobacteria bacterium]|nr:deoxyribonuclease IV [Deltaproteobacteria bacterium]